MILYIRSLIRLHGMALKKRATPLRRRFQVSRAAPWQETYLAQTHFRKMETTRNHPH
jgi:hypothetical protein